MSKHRLMGLFRDFDEAFAAIADIRANKIPGVSVDDVTLKSPIEHPEIEEVLGERPAHVPKFTLMGAVFGVTGDRPDPEQRAVHAGLKLLNLVMVTANMYRMYDPSRNR